MSLKSSSFSILLTLPSGGKRASYSGGIVLSATSKSATRSGCCPFPPDRKANADDTACTGLLGAPPLSIARQRWTLTRETCAGGPSAAGVGTQMSRSSGRRLACVQRTVEHDGGEVNDGFNAEQLPRSHMTKEIKVHSPDFYRLTEQRKIDGTVPNRRSLAVLHGTLASASS
jgi:hypothetical protein